jgi:DNA replication protein DnaC
MANSERGDLLDVIEERHSHATNIIAISSRWINGMSKSAIPSSFTDAILDRLIHNAQKINLKGGSLRKNMLT